MARTIGSIDVIVNADTGRLVAQLRRAGQVGGRAMREAVDDELKKIGGRELRQRLVELRGEIEAALAIDVEVGLQLPAREIREIRAELDAELSRVDVEIGADLDTADVRREVAEARRVIDAADTDLDVEPVLDVAALRRVLAAADALIAAADPTARIGAALDVTQLRRVLSEARALVAAADADLGVGAQLDTSDVRRALAEAEALVTAARTDINVGVQLAVQEVLQAIAFTKGLLAAADADIDIGADVNTADIVASVAQAAATAAAAAAGTGGVDIGKGFTQAGADAGQNFGSGVASGISKSGPQVGAVIAGVLAQAVQPATVALEGLAGASIAVIASGFSAIAAAAGSAAPLVAGLATSFGALKVGLDGIEEALDGDAEALAALTPAARDFVDAWSGLRPQFEAIRDVVQEGLFAGLGDELERLGRIVLPQIGAGLEGAAAGLNRFFRQLGEVAADIDFGAIFAGIQPAVDSLLDAVVELARTVEPFLVAAAPAAQRFAEMLRDGARALSDMVEAGRDSGAIAEFLDEGLDSLREWAGLAGAVTDALFTLFDAGRDAGDSFVASLAGIIRQFDAWMESVEGQEALAGFFADTKEIIGDLAPLVKGMIGFFDRIVTPDAIDRFGRITEAIGDLLPVFGSLFDIFGRASEPLIRMLEIGAKVAAIFAAAWEKIPEPLKDAAFLIAELSTGGFLPLLLTNLDKLEPVIDAVGSAFGFVGDAIRTVAGLIADFIDMVDRVPGLNAFVEAVTGIDFGEAADDLRRFGEEGHDVGMRWGHVPKTVDAANVTLERLAGNLDTASGAAQDFHGTLVPISAAALGLEPAVNDAAAAVEGYTDETLAAAAATAVSTRSLQGNAEELQRLQTDLLNATDALGEMNTVFNRMARNDDALSRVFDLGNAPKVAAAKTRDIQEGIGDLVEEFKGVKVGDVIAGNFRADKVLDAFDDLRPQIQDKLEESFALDPTGAQASEQAAAFITQVTKALGGKLTREQVAEQLGLTDFQAKIDIAVELSQVEEAKAELNALTGLGGETPLTASIQLALDKGLLSGDAAQAILNVLALDKGIPAEVLPEVTPEGMAEAQTFLAQHPGLLPVGVEFPDPMPKVPAVPPVEVPILLDFSDPTVGQAAGELGALLTPSGNAFSIGAEVTILVNADTTAAQEGIDGLKGDLDTLNTTTAAPSVKVPFIDSTIGKVQTLDSLIRDLPTSKTIRVNVQGTGGVTIPGGVSLGLPGAMAGELITRPTMRWLGERGMHEAVVPLDLPLSRVDPSVRELAAMLRGEVKIAGAPSGPRTVVTQHFELSNADPRAVAEQVLNRAAVMANR